MVFTSLTEEEFLVLNYMYLVECTTPELLTHFMKEDEARAREIIKRFKDKGYVVVSDNFIVISDDAKKIVEELRKNMVRKLEGNIEVVMNIIKKLEEVNNEVKDVITQWQIKKIGGVTVINDHQDLAYDERVIKKLRRTHAKAEKLLNDLSQYLPHFKYYVELLNIALKKVLDENVHEYVDKHPASYHNVWYVAHEDWLRLFGLKRVE
ncbi:MAG: hypothetical protein ACP5KB_05865 [Thermoprotei archaeon]|mgnify:CR=1 FL=1